MAEQRGDEGPWVLQFCHGYDGPFLDCARQYAALFQGTPYRVCTVFLTGRPDAEVAQAAASAEVHFLDFSTRRIRGLKLAAIRAFARIAAQRDYAFCIAHRSKPIYVALLATRLPVIGVLHAFGAYERIHRRLFAHFFQRRLLLLGVSNAVRDEIRAALPSWPRDRIETLYNRIDLAAVQAAQLERDAARRALGLTAQAWAVVNVGRLHPDKDQATLIRAFARARPTLPAGSELVIIGSGRLQPALAALIDELGLNAVVRLQGQLPAARNYLRAFDLFVLSSDHEPFGMVLLEAMAADLPVLATDCGGAAEVIADPQWQFALGDEERLAHKMSVVAAQRDADHGRQAHRQRLSEHFSDAAVRERFWHLPRLQALRRH